MWMVNLTLQMKIHLQTSALANELWCSVKRTLVASDEIQVNVMQKSVIYGKLPNVVDIYCKHPADAIKIHVMPVAHNQVLGQKCFHRTNVRNQHLERTLSTM